MYRSCEFVNPNHFQTRRNLGPRVPYKQTFGEPPRNQDNVDYWCETCDRGFPSLHLFDKHNQQHQKCNIDGCQFVAHPKVITKHIQMQHSSGLYKQISNLKNPEDIKKWIEERKKRFPTKKNIEKKVAEAREKVERGEKLGLRTRSISHYKSDSTKYNIHVNSNHKRTLRKNNAFCNGRNQLNNKRTPSRKIQKVLPLRIEKNKLKPFEGIQNIMLEEDKEESIDSNCVFQIDDDDFENSLENLLVLPTKTSKPELCGALSSLLCDYGSSEDEKEKLETNTVDNYYPKKIETVQNNKEQNTQKVSKSDTNRNNHEKSDDESGPEEVITIKNDFIGNYPEKEKRKEKVHIQKKPHHSKHVTNKPKHNLPSTLLQKLLSKEMQHERNIILQSIRFIRKNSYFD